MQIVNYHKGRSRVRSQKGAEMVEYALIAAALIGVFIVVGLALRAAANRRSEEAARTAESAAPCPIGEDLSSDACL